MKLAKTWRKSDCVSKVGSLPRRLSKTFFVDKALNTRDLVFGTRRESDAEKY